MKNISFNRTLKKRKKLYGGTNKEKETEKTQNGQLSSEPLASATNNASFNSDTMQKIDQKDGLYIEYNNHEKGFHKIGFLTKIVEYDGSIKLLITNESDEKAIIIEPEEIDNIEIYYDYIGSIISYTKNDGTSIKGLLEKKDGEYILLSDNTEPIPIPKEELYKIIKYNDDENLKMYSTNYDTDERFKDKFNIPEEMFNLQAIYNVSGFKCQQSWCDSDERAEKNLLMYGYKRVKVRGDGNCQFHAVVDQLKKNGVKNHEGKQLDHKYLRELVVKWLEDNENKKINTIPLPYMHEPGPDEEDYDPNNYISWNKALELYKKDGTWGTNLTLIAISHIFKVNIVTINNQDYKDKEKCKNEFYGLLLDSKEIENIIVLCHLGFAHYDSTTKLSEKEIETQIKKGNARIIKETKEEKEKMKAQQKRAAAERAAAVNTEVAKERADAKSAADAKAKAIAQAEAETQPQPQTKAEAAKAKAKAEEKLAAQAKAAAPVTKSVTNPVTTPTKPKESIVLLEISGKVEREDINIYIEYLKTILNTTNFTVELFEINTSNEEKIDPNLLKGGGDIIKNVLKIKGTISEEQVPSLTSQNIGKITPTLLKKVESEEDANNYLEKQGIKKETKPTIIHESKPISSTSIIDTHVLPSDSNNSNNFVSDILNTDIDITNSSNIGLYMVLMGLGTAVTFLIL